MHSIVQSSQAEQDLIDIWVYTAEEWSLAQADSYLEELVSGMDRLREHPMIGTSRDDLRKDYRALTVSQHLVFYKVSEDEVQIIRVLHKSVDSPRHL